MSTHLGSGTRASSSSLWEGVCGGEVGGGKLLALCCLNRRLSILNAAYKTKDARGMSLISNGRSRNNCANKIVYVAKLYVNIHMQRDATLNCSTQKTSWKVRSVVSWNQRVKWVGVYGADG